MKQVEVVMKRNKECQGSVRFATDDRKAPVTNIYISRDVEGVDKAQAVTVKVTVN